MPIPPRGPLRRPTFAHARRALAALLLLCGLAHACCALAGARDPRPGIPLRAPGFDVPARDGVAAMRVIPLAGTRLRSPVVSAGTRAPRIFALMGS